MRARIAAAVAIVAAFVALAALMTPPYLDNWELSQALDEVAHREDAAGLNDEQLRAAAAQKAAELGVPVRPEQFSVARRPGGLRIEGRYQVRVDLWVYTVDLHLRARGGS